MNKDKIVLSQAQRMVKILEAHPLTKFTARELTILLLKTFPESYIEKRHNPRFQSDEDFIKQVVAEVGSDRLTMLKYCQYIHWQDQPRPRIFWFDPSRINPNLIQEQPAIEPVSSTAFSEHSLYPILIEYLSKELHLFNLRIDEKTSKNSRGQNGNQWLHPDIVSMQPIDQQWHELVRSCVKHGSGQNVRLWSFEVKKELNGSNIRSSFFQAVSNSSWANEGYLVTTSISSNEVEEELRMLSALHGIGVIILNMDNPTESEILLPARRKSDVDWQSINRILTENTDFQNFIRLVSIYYQTGLIHPQDWNH